MDNHKFSICFPDGWFPEWFAYKTCEPSLSVNLPQNWCNNKFLGFAICVAGIRRFGAGCLHDFVTSQKFALRIHFSYKTHDGLLGDSFDELICNLGSKWSTDSECTCLAYFPYPSLGIMSYENLNEWSEIVVGGFGGLRYGGYGLQLVYEDDVKQAEAEAEADELLIIQNNSSY